MGPSSLRSRDPGHSDGTGVKIKLGLATPREEEAKKAQVEMFVAAMWKRGPQRCGACLSTLRSTPGKPFCHWEQPLGTAITSFGQGRGPEVGLPYLSHHRQAQLQTQHGPEGSTALGEQLQTRDSIRSSQTLARSDSGVAQNLGIALQLVQLEIREKHVPADNAPDGDTGPLGFASATYHSHRMLPCLAVPGYEIGIIKFTSSIKCFEICE